MAGDGSEEVGFTDTEHIAGHRSGRQAFRIDPGAVYLGIFLTQDADHRLYSVKSHRRITFASLPFHFHDHKPFFSSQFREAGSLALGAGIVPVAM